MILCPERAYAQMKPDDRKADAFEDITVDAQGRLVIEFVRRQAATDPRVGYTVETGSDPTALTALSFSGATVVAIDSVWERVTVTDPTITTQRSGRVRVTTN